MSYLPRSIYVGCVALLLAAVSLNVGAAESSEPSAGRFVDLLSMDGQPSTGLTGIGQGKWSVVMIWATNCPICAQQKPILSDFHNRHKDTDAEVIGIALDGRRGVADVQSYWRKHKVTFPTFIGESQVVAVNYAQIAEENFLGTPTYVLFSPTGELAAINPGPLTDGALDKFIARKSK